MQSILKELCWFCQDTNERSGVQNPGIRKATHTLDKYETFLLKRLKGKKLKMFRKMIAASLDMSFHSNEAGFIDGAKFGAKLVLELLVN